MKKIINAKIILIIGLCVIAFFCGSLSGKSSNKIENLLDIEQWDVKKFSYDDVVIYESDNSNAISEENKEGWNKLLGEISIVGYRRKKTEGSTAHSKYEIEMNNGDIYYIEWLGCLNQVDITYPNGETIMYYAYHQ